MKRMFLMLAFLVGASTASASYLYWQLDTADLGSDIDVDNYKGVRVVCKDTSSGETTYCEVYSVVVNPVDGTASYIDTGYTDAYVLDGSDPKMGEKGTAKGLTVMVDDGTSYSFMIELINYDEYDNYKDTYAQSQWETYDNLYNKGYVDTALTPVTPLNVWHASGFAVVPEPTSAMLMMVGLALVGLKRRNRRIDTNG